jgi:hypothetical protein
MEFEIGQKFTGIYPPEAASWCNANNAMIVKLDSGEYEIQAIPEPTIEEKNEAIRQTRASLYTELVDPLHAQKTKDTIMDEWSEEREQEYIAEVKRLTIKIREENPYIETVD